MRERRIRVTGKPKAQIDLDLLAQVILLLVEQRLAEEGDQKSSAPGGGDVA